MGAACLRRTKFDLNAVIRSLNSIQYNCVYHKLKILPGK